MKRLLVAVLLGLAFSAFAATVSTISLYTDANKNSKVVATLPTNTQLIPIFRQGDWLKVGNPKNGQTGWVNYKDYLGGQSNGGISDNMQAIFAQNGKVTAYENGKQLPDADAKALYEKAQKQQQNMNQQFIKIQDQMNKAMTQGMQSMDQLFAQSANQGNNIGKKIGN